MIGADASGCYTTFEIPQGDIDARQGGHEHRPAAIEAKPPYELPNVLDVAAASQHAGSLLHVQGHPLRLLANETNNDLI